MELGNEFGRVNMPEQKPHILVNFLVRAIIGIAIIFFGIPGVALLYGITFYQIL